MYLVFEGMAGSGKTTQTKKLFEYLKEKLPSQEIVYTREPGGTEIAEDIRQIVQGKEYAEEMEYVCEAYLYAASRAQALRKIVKPVLDKNGLVIADRSFVTSLVYQGLARGLGLDKVYEINKHAIEGFMPDYVFYFYLDPNEAVMRQKDQAGDKWEKHGIEFYKNIAIWHEEVSKHPLLADKWIQVDASGSIDEVFDRLITILTSKSIISL